MAAQELNGEAAKGACKLCGSSTVAGATYCRDCGRSLRAPAPEGGIVSPPIWVEPSQSGTRCRGCGRASDVNARYCAFCGTALSRSAVPRSRASGSAATLAAIPLLEPVLEDLDQLLADGQTTLLVIVERSSTDMLDACRAHFELDEDVVWQVSAHPSRARVPHWATRDLLRQIEAAAEPPLAARAAALRARLRDEPGADVDALVETFLEIIVEHVPFTRPSVILDRAHRASRGSMQVLVELARLAAIRVILRSPVPLGDAVQRPGAVLTHPLAGRPTSPATLSDIASLSKGARDVLEAAATLGWSAPKEAVDELVEGRLAQGFDALRALGLLEVWKDRLRFVDPDLADWIRAGLSERERDRWSSAALAWEASQDAPVEVRAEHAAGLADLPTAALLLDVAGRAALARGDSALAITHLSRALQRVRAADSLEPDAAICRTGAQLARTLARVLLREGDHRTAEGVLREALERPLLEPVDKAALSVLVAAVALGRGRRGDARRGLEGAVRQAEHENAPVVALDARLWLAIVAESEGGTTAAVAGSIADAFARAAGATPSRQALGLLTTLVRKLVGRGDRARALQMLEAVGRETSAFDRDLEKLREALLES